MGCVNVSTPDCSANNGLAYCPDKFGCPPDQCPDFTIKQHDTKPFFKVNVEEDSEPMDLTGLVLEASMWANAKLKRDITEDDTSIALVADIGYYQILVDDIILMDRVRSPEYMKVTGFDEANKLVYVERGFNGSTPSEWKKGTVIKIFRIMNAPAVTEMVYDDIIELDGTKKCDVLIESYFVYEWNPNDTCVPGCFWFEFKLLKMVEGSVAIPSTTPMCSMGVGVEWVRRFPNCGSFLIKICQSPTAEL